MPHLNPHITFRAVNKEDENLVREWLAKPHVAEWYHGDGLQNTLDGLVRFVTQNNPSFDLWLGLVDSIPFAFLMTSNLDESIQQDKSDPIAQYIEPGKKMSTLDLLIGEEKYLGRGLGKKLILAFLDDVLADTDIVFIDPEKLNVKAIHTYQKAGFEMLDEFIASWHPVPHVLMRLKK